MASLDETAEDSFLEIAGKVGKNRLAVWLSSSDEVMMIRADLHCCFAASSLLFKERVPQQRRRLPCLILLSLRLWEFEFGPAVFLLEDQSQARQRLLHC